MGTKIPESRRLALVADRKDTLVRIRGARREVRLARSAVRQALFKVNGPQHYQRGSAQSGTKGTRNRKGGHGRASRSNSGFGRGGRGRGRLGREVNLVTRGPSPGEEDKEDFATPGRQLRPAYAFSVEQLDDPKEQRGALVTLIIGAVDVPDVVVDSGASCNVRGQRTWELPRQKRIKCEPCKSSKELFAYGACGSVQPLPTLGTFTADVKQAGFKDGSKADFVVVEGDGRMLLGCETAKALSLLCVGPFQATSVGGERPDGDVREKFKS